MPASTPTFILPMAARVALSDRAQAALDTLFADHAPEDRLRAIVVNPHGVSNSTTPSEVGLLFSTPQGLEIASVRRAPPDLVARAALAALLISSDPKIQSLSPSPAPRSPRHDRIALRGRHAVSWSSRSRDLLAEKTGTAYADALAGKRQILGLTLDGSHRTAHRHLEDCAGTAPFAEEIYAALAAAASGNKIRSKHRSVRFTPSREVLFAHLAGR